MAITYPKDISIPYVPTDGTIYYPDEDGLPMAASDYHLSLLIWTLQALDAHFDHKPDVYISGDILMYYREGDPRKSISPDILVCFGINPEPRKTYKVWEEGKAPDFVMEFSSDSTYRKDFGEKMDVYASLEIQDYFLYDAEGLYLPTPLMGFTLEDGVYMPIPFDDDGSVRSSALDLDFCLQDGEIRIYDPVADEWILTRAEQTEIAEARAEQETIARENAEARAEQETIARENAEARAEQETIARENAEALTEQATIARETAEARAEQETIARENAEAEVAQLREELARLKARS